MPIYNTTGPKSVYVYTTDGLAQYGILLSDTVAAITGFPLATSSQEALPGRTRLRKVWIETVSGGKKYRRRVPCPTVDNTVYAAETSQPLTIDGQVWYTTGRVGEKRSFPRYTAP